MATDIDLRSGADDLETDLELLYPRPEVGEDELGACRLELRAALEREKTRGRFRRRVGMSLAAVAALAVMMLRLPVEPSLTFEQRSLEDVRAFVAESEDRARLSERALQVLESEDPLARRNARLVRVMTQPAPASVAQVGEGVLDEPRADVRAFYLEWLLDRADEQIVDARKVEALIDDEDDPLCRDLLGEMLRITERTRRVGGAAASGGMA